MDRTVSDGFVIVNMTRDLRRPVSMKVVLLTGLKSAGKDGQDNSDFSKVEHVAYHYEYRFDRWAEIDRFVVPKDARAILESR